MKVSQSVLLALALSAGAAFAGAPGRGDGPPPGPPQPTPHLPDGTPDLGGNGVWNLPYLLDISKYMVNGQPGDTPKQGQVPFLPWTKAMYDYTQANENKYDPESFCLPPGGPRAFGTPYPAQFIQEKRRVIVIFEGGAHVWREIFMDGRPHPTGDKLNPTYFGHSVGHYEGDALVVDTVGFNERSWLMFNGFMHTDQLHTIEKFTRPDRRTLRYEVTVDDPGAYEHPWIAAWNIPWREGQDLTEYICQEENQYLIDLKDDLGEPFFRPTRTEKEGS